ncbi:hypothetical protein OEZ85_004673 [Tetradesmus obliquus]|uniref:3'-5' exonuclease domain-containing protein n=1 Tax=Tetradesmus obliquus TaxID=3088 RepID=A0ABY8ULV7_TETOB|nr:hypothetical protein OEZ85_004673 [Tetradesmus obliquus]
MQQLKPARLPTRKSLQYENCRILGPDGKPLATCGIKKVRWYLDRQLAEVVEEAPHIAIKLKFTPRGSGHADDQYYLSDKDNRCVVCGQEGEYLRHSIVPHCYRQHFPPAMKSHLSHDVVLLCVGCHQICNMLDQRKMAELGQRYGAPLEDEARRFKVDRQLAQVRSAGKALASRSAAGKIPAARVQQLRQVILCHFGVTEWRAELANLALAVEPKRQDESWESHASVVVAAIVSGGRQQQQQQQQAAGADQQQQDVQMDAALGEFIRDWRRHFLAAMQPKFLPPFWSVDARVKNSSGTDMPPPCPKP